MSKLRLFTLLLVGSMGMSLHAQQPVRMEYFLDTDPGHGAARQLALTQSGESSMTLDLSDAAPGAHILYMRTQDDRGLWSSTVARPVYVREKTPEPPVRVEYFLDTDPGYGKATPISNLLLGESTMTFDLSHYADGAHVLCVRSQDATGKWSTVLNRPLFIDRFQDIVRKHAADENAEIFPFLQDVCLKEVKLIPLAEDRGQLLAEKADVNRAFIGVQNGHGSAKLNIINRLKNDQAGDGAKDTDVL